MPRPPRYIFAGECYHVLNRANRKAVVFHDSSDYQAFINLVAKAQQHLALPLFAACLMPNHVHLVVRPNEATDIGRWMHWLFTTHARHYHEKYGTTGHVWQGRYKSFLIQDDHYLLSVMRYVERNALRAKIVSHAEDWRWGSLRWRGHGDLPLTLTPPPIELPKWWTEYVNQPQTSAELEAIRTSVNRQRPYGDPEWVMRRASDAGLDQSLVNVGRPRRIRSGPFC